MSYYSSCIQSRNKLNFDIIDHKENGYLSKPFDIDDLNNGIEWILNLDKNIYNQLCDNARNKALIKYNPIKVSNKYFNLYKNIIKKNKPIITLKN